MKSQFPRPLLVVAAALLCTLSGTTLCRADSADLAELGIDALMQTEVTSASRKQQKLADTPAAIYVLTSDDIRKMGATTLPELLRMVPGVEGGAINSHIHGIGIRGLTGQWSNKLLVLIDGRSIYTRMFSGVYWDSHNLPLEDIERIEVIRGANAALWGANAVNGVINILTKNSAKTVGTLVRGSVGSDHSSDAFVRHGMALGAAGYGRAYISAERHANSASFSGGEANDDWQTYRIGARGDWEFRSGTRLMATAEHFSIDSDNDQAFPPAEYDGISLGTLDPASSVNGHTLHMALTRAYALTSEWTAQVSWSKVRRDEFLGMKEESVDLDFQHRFQPLERHDVVWGVNARYRRDETDPLLFSRFDPIGTHDVNASVFLQDEISLLGDRLRLTVGSRFEHDEHNKWEMQPSVRGLWNISDRQKLWAAVSRAARTPSRFDRDLDINVPLLLDPRSNDLPAGLPSVPGNGSPLPVILAIRGNKAFKTETMLSYEVGYRLQPTPATSLDLALFHNRYQNLSSLGFNGVGFSGGTLLIDLPFANSREGAVWGGELVANWTPRPEWRLELFWAEQRLDFEDGAQTDSTFTALAEGASPERQVGLRAEWDINPTWSASVQFRYVSGLNGFFNSGLTGGRIPAYVDADTVVTWQATPQFALSLLGKNLLDRSRMEFASEMPVPPVEIRRAAFLRASWSF